MSTLHFGRSSHKKIGLLNMYKKDLIPTFGLCNIHIFLLLEDGNGTKCWYTQKPRKIGRSTVLEPNRKPEFHNRVTNPMFHFYCILSTKKQRYSKWLLCSFAHPENCKNSPVPCLPPCPLSPAFISVKSTGARAKGKGGCIWATWYSVHM